MCKAKAQDKSSTHPFFNCDFQTNCRERHGDPLANSWKHKEEAEEHGVQLSASEAI